MIKRISRRATFNFLIAKEGYVEDLEMGGWHNAFLTTDEPSHVIWQQLGHGENEWRVDLRHERYTSFRDAQIAATEASERANRLLGLSR